MNYKRTATIAVVGGALAAWLAAAFTPMAHVPAPSTRKTSIEKSGAELANEIARLHERLRPSTPPREQARNLFRFNASRPTPEPLGGYTASEPVVTAPAPPPAPAFKLSGIAEDPGPHGPIRTAIISSPGELFLVKEGDMVTARFRVARIAPDVVELVDVVTDAPLRLALR